MKRIIFVVFFSVLLAVPVHALDITAPEVPESVQSRMPSNRESFGQGLLEILQDALAHFRPDLKEASGVCLGVTAAMVTVTVIQSFSGSAQRISNLAGTVAIAAILLQSAYSLIYLGTQTVTELSEYGKLLLPVLTTALAAQGGVTTSSALYAGTAAFDAVMSSLISKILIPMVYLFLALAAAGSAVGEDLLKRLRDMVKGCMIWILKTILYVFTGYLAITGVVSGTTDAAAVKAAKLTISGAVPVVGGILSDASEAILVSAGTVKNAVGLYGLFALAAIWLSPFLKIGVHYLLLKLTASACGIFGSKQMTDLVCDFSSAMGILLGMTGAVCLMLLVSIFCFLKGAA